ncbi:MerR family transcriptional regulator [Nocardia sp. NPDC050630]|uniref:MerR family transcriptional regulator n=1 Tax=Nocardia sp. NPDC050630 TaxID=3364321 RepID=UPI0037AB0D97
MGGAVGQVVGNQQVVDPDREKPQYSIGEAADRSGLSRDTLRWYERIGLMNYIGRDHAGKRRFSNRDLEWLALIGRLRTTGMSVADMVRYAELVREGESTVPERLQMFRNTRAEVLAKIDELHQTLSVLDYKIDLYEGKTAAVKPAALTKPCEEMSFTPVGRE